MRYLRTRQIVILVGALATLAAALFGWIRGL